MIPANEETPARLMPVRRMREEMRRKAHRWAVILANASGRECRFISCSEARQSASGETFRQAQGRIGQCIPYEHTFLVVRNEQDPFPRDAVTGYPAEHIILQSTDVGTLPVMLWSLLHLARLDPDAVVGFLPLSASSQDAGGFVQAVRDAFNLVQSNFCQDAVIMLGTPPNQLDADCGWIEPQPSILGCSGGKVRPVLRFWDRPSQQITRDLIQRGCLLNTCGMVGRLDAFRALIRGAEPEWLQTFESAWKREIPSPTVAATCHFVPAGDFSRHILTVSIGKLLVLPVREGAASKPALPQ